MSKIEQFTGGVFFDCLSPWSILDFFFCDFFILKKTQKRMKYENEIEPLLNFLHDEYNYRYN